MPAGGTNSPTIRSDWLTVGICGGDRWSSAGLRVRGVPSLSHSITASYLLVAWCLNSGLLSNGWQTYWRENCCTPPRKQLCPIYLGAVRLKRSCEREAEFSGINARHQVMKINHMPHRKQRSSTKPAGRAASRTPDTIGGFDGLNVLDFSTHFSNFQWQVVAFVIHEATANTNVPVYPDSTWLVFVHSWDPTVQIRLCVSLSTGGAAEASFKRPKSGMSGRIQPHSVTFSATNLWKDLRAHAAILPWSELQLSYSALAFSLSSRGAFIQTAQCGSSPQLRMLVSQHRSSRKGSLASVCSYILFPSRQPPFKWQHSFIFGPRLPKSANWRCFDLLANPVGLHPRRDILLWLAIWYDECLTGCCMWREAPLPGGGRCCPCCRWIPSWK